jgi:hypothetical protein
MPISETRMTDSNMGSFVAGSFTGKKSTGGRIITVPG